MLLLTLRASPMQKRSGVVLRRDGALRVAIAVLPKLWRETVPRDQVSAWTVEWDQDALTATVHEGDVLTVRISGEHSERKAALLESLAVECRNDDDAEQVLFAPAPIDRLPRAAPVAAFDAAAIDLMQLADLAGIDPTEAIAGDFDASLTELDWLLPFLHRRFVHNVADAMRHARRGYTERRESLDTLRGRPRGESLALAIATGVPVVECEFEEFEFATPLLRAIASALEAVARASLPTMFRHSDSLRGIAAESSSMAIGLRNRIAEVPALSAHDATRVARSLRVHRLERAWEPALRLIEPILLRAAPAPSSTTDSPIRAESLSAAEGGRYLRVELPTWKVWQALLTAAARSLGTLRPSGAHPPWDKLQNDLAPDIDLLWNGRRAVIDAKYKHFDRGLSVSDAYQMFAYSHLVRGHPPSRHLFLMYPDPAGEIRARGYRRMPQYLPGDQPRLGLVPLRWPSRSDLADPAAYREVLRDQFARSIASMA